MSKQLAAFFSKMAPQMANQMMNQPFTMGTVAEQGYSGVPVRHIMTVGGRQITTELSEVSRQNFPDSVLQVPAGFQKTDMMGGRGRQTGTAVGANGDVR